MMTDDQFSESFEKWEVRFQESSIDEWLIRPEPAFEVKVAVNEYRAHYGEGRPRAIDIGAGDGRHTLYLAEQGFDVLAIDAAPSGVDLIRQKLARESLDAELVVADLRTFELPDDIDLLVSSYILHLLPEPYEQLKTWQAKTRPGGICSVATRGPFGDDPDHYWFPEDFEFKRLFEAAGWFVIHAREEENWRPDLNLHFRQHAVVARKPD
jgi:SAM-dependent methyltransferase